MRSKWTLVTTLAAIVIAVIVFLIAYCLVNCRVEWSPAKVEIDVIQGTNRGTMLAIKASANIPYIEILVSPSLERLLSVDDRGIDRLPQDELVNFSASFRVPADTPPGDYEGTVQIRIGNKVLGHNLPDPLPVILHVVEASADVIPPGPADPSAVRITQDAEGQKWIKDEVVVLLDLDTADADGTIKEIAAATGGVILGSIPETFTYQIQYEVADDTELQKKIEDIAKLPPVTAAVRNFIAEPAAATPTDPQYTDVWDEDNPDGDNYHFEMVRALTAWTTTAEDDEEVKVGVIDGDIRKTHEDLVNNMSYKQLSGAGGSCPFEGHGTRIAGIIGAEANNAKGVAGMKWDVDLQGFDFSDSSCTTAHAQLMMLAAVNRGVDIVNMSLQWINTNQCGTLGTPDTLDLVAQANAVLGQGILWAQREEGKDVLWVFGAGNECRETKYASPASLVDRFPLNTMAVAAVTSTRNLRDDSNYGCLVTVAAPGTFIRSTDSTSNNSYANSSGTSLAAPMVAGLAALLKAHDPTRTAAEIKNCIVANPGPDAEYVLPPTDTDHPNPPDSSDLEFFIIDAEAALDCGSIVPLPPKVDLVISIDSSGSMRLELDRLLKANINTALNDLVNAASATDFRFGVVSYEDYNGSFDSNECDDSNYSAPYGSGSKPDSPFRIEQAMTDDIGIVQTAVSSIEPGYGADGPESYGRVYWELAKDEPIDPEDNNKKLTFRSDALRIILDFGDSVPHDTNLRDGVGPEDNPPPTVFNNDTGIDPGQNNEIDYTGNVCTGDDCTGDDCTGDDIDFQDDALVALKENDVRLIHVDSSNYSDLIPYWQNWVGRTGGAFETIDGDGSIPAGKSLSELIIDLLRAIPPCSN